MQKLNLLWEWLSRRDNVTFLIAVAGFCLSIVTFVQNMSANRKRLKISLSSIGYAQDIMCVRLSIENRSQLPVSITDIVYRTDKTRYHCSPDPKLLCQFEKRRNGVIISQESTYSSELPIHLPALGAFNDLLLFEGLKTLPENSSKRLTFEISTNRGRTLRRKLELPEGDHSLRKMF